MTLHHIAITIRDLERSIVFYKDHFGFEEVKRFERVDLGGRATFLALEGVLIELWEFRDVSEDTPSVDTPFGLKSVGIRHIAFKVENIDEEREKLKSKGIEVGEIKIGASGGRYAFLKDPDGINLELYEVNK